MDVRQPELAQTVGSFGWETPFRSIDVAGGYAYALDGRGLVILSLTDPTIPQFVTTYRLPGSPWRVRVAGDHAYVVDYDGMLQVIDVANPAAPRLVGAYPVPKASDIGAGDDMMYLGGEGFLALDVSVATDSLTVAGNSDWRGTALDANGDTLALADPERGVMLLAVWQARGPVYLPVACRTWRIER